MEAKLLGRMLERTLDGRRTVPEAFFDSPTVAYLFLDINDFAVVADVNWETFTTAPCNLLVDGFGQTLNHVANSLVEKSGIHIVASVVVGLHVPVPHIALRRESSVCHFRGCGR